MEHNDWDKISDRFEEKIFSVFHNDRKRLIAKRIERLGAPDKSASDLGCGIGAFLPTLAQSFGTVLAADISGKCLERAKARHAKHQNIAYRTADLGAKGIRLPKADFVLSVNALLMPSLTHRNRSLDTVTRTVARKGHLLLVTPALESILLTEQRLIEWNLRIGVPPAAATRTELRSEARDLHQGIVPINGMPTKHFLREELVVALESRGLRVEELRKIEYRWDNEFNDPPGWMKNPYPWDWLVLAKR